MECNVDLTKFSESTKQYLEKLIYTLQKEQGKISRGNEVQIELLGYNLDIFNECVSDIKERGNIVKSRENYVKNPSLSILNQANITINKILTQMGLTNLSKQKMKTFEEEDDLLESLISNK